MLFEWLKRLAKFRYLFRNSSQAGAGIGRRDRPDLIMLEHAP
jgi:hypothetical protein